MALTILFRLLENPHFWSGVVATDAHALLYRCPSVDHYKIKRGSAVYYRTKGMGMPQKWVIAAGLTLFFWKENGTVFLLKRADEPKESHFLLLKININ